MAFYPENSIPRIHLVKENGKIACYLDEKLQRFGPVLFTNNKQGRHLFSISYCIAWMAVKYNNLHENVIIDDILSRFHCDFLTLLIINSKFTGTVTHFLKDWEIHFDDLTLAYEAMSSRKEIFDIDELQDYLNLVGIMLHTLPCNVAFADNASDPEGGVRAKEAISNLRWMANTAYEPRDMNQNISLTLDSKLIQEIFSKGFDDNNGYVLAFMIMQIMELQSLQRKGQSYHLNVDLNNEEIERDVFDIAFKASNSNIPRNQSFSEAISKAVDLIDSTKREVNRDLQCKRYQSIKSTIQRGMDNVYSLSY